MDELQLAKEVEAEIKRRLKAREAKPAAKAGRGTKIYWALPDESWATWIERTAPAED